ncbi:Transcription factor, SBP-box [Cynara cardunculus var. scolymus]|uniref:Transcription factor, SBP-box n=1 Tax=Cynara cardunculus var. scolymus TaxID=59895 RepID=A0A103Y456_CYNCS|nr:Transcription factor, SBP-box [Cynara cardunculus var. scolymus]
MDSRNRSPRNPTIVLKFKNPSMAMEQLAEDDYLDDDAEESGQGYLQFGANGGIKKKKMVDSGAGGGGSGKRETAAINGGRMTPSCCQVDSCAADLAVAKRYHRRHKVCEVHSKAPVVVVAGILQRFHEVSEFDDARRSCRSRLAGHNERRRKSSSEATSVDIQGSSLGQVGDRRSRTPVALGGERFRIG